jgi:hypothetical protein
MTRLRNQRVFTQMAYVGGENGASGSRRVEGIGT